MKIAIIGGGAAGLTTACLLDKTHDVTVFEKQPVLGGNIRTLNKNVCCDALDPNIILDNGVIEFERDFFPNFHKLMNHLNVQLEEIPLTSEIFLANGQHYKSAGAIVYGCKTRLQQIMEILKLTPVAFSYFYFLVRMMFTQQKTFQHRPVSDFIGNSISGQWLKMLLMYAYSMPYQKINDFPAEIGIPLLNHSGMFTKWDRIVGGVYTYIEKIIAQFKGSIHCNATIVGVTRESNRVNIKFINGELQHFDKVVFASTPDQVLALLKDASENETRRFKNWDTCVIDTVIHTDISFYKHFGVSYFSEFDVFQNQENGDCGYNAYLDRLCGVNADTEQHFSLAYNMEKHIDPAKIIDRQQHVSPAYNVESIRYRQEIKDTNGENNTYHAGAYLFEGLHEGAVTSGFVVSALLGGLCL